jgi:hypothetical protein
VYAGLIFFPLHSALRQKFQRTVGQPLGFLSSWPLFTLTTHYLAGAVSGWIQAYAMKGDDIVIGDSRVAEEYRHLKILCPVALMFAKRLIIRKAYFCTDV